MSAIKKIVAISFILIILGGLGLYYSYSNIEVDVQSISLGYPPVKVDVTKAVLIGVSAILTGGVTLPALLKVIEGINLEIDFEVTNRGFLSIAIPSFNFEVYLNGYYSGIGSTFESITVGPGKSEYLKVKYTITVDQLLSILSSIIENDGYLEIRVKGEAPVKLVGIEFGIPFEKVYNINVYEIIYQQVKNAISQIISQDGSQSKQTVDQGAERTGSINIDSVVWMYRGDITYSVPKGSVVTVLIKLSAYGGDVEGVITVKIKEDLALMPDRVYKEFTESIYLREGESVTLTFEFVAEGGGLGFRGYFIEIVFPDGSKWTMESSYPPRLKVG